MCAADAPSRLIADAAEAAFGPLGLSRKGRSRLWFDDRLWHAIAIEFQPAGWSGGTRLIAGIAWLWFPTAYWSFDVGHGEAGEAAFESEAQFTAALAPLIADAVERVETLRSRYASLRSALAHAGEGYRDGMGRDGWPELHLGVLAALAGDIGRSRSLLATVANRPSDDDGVDEDEMARYCETAMDRLADRTRFRDWVEDQIRNTRAMRGLPPCGPVCLPSD